jgi:hypothetical protein
MKNKASEEAEKQVAMRLDLYVQSSYSRMFFRAATLGKG